jgi:hypothetical protein
VAAYHASVLPCLCFSTIESHGGVTATDAAWGPGACNSPPSFKLLGCMIAETYCHAASLLSALCGAPLHPVGCVQTGVALSGRLWNLKAQRCSLRNYSAVVLDKAKHGSSSSPGAGGRAGYIKQEPYETPTHMGCGRAMSVQHDWPDATCP